MGEVIMGGVDQTGTVQNNGIWELCWKKLKVHARLKPSSRATEVTIFHFTSNDFTPNFNNIKLEKVC